MKRIIAIAAILALVPFYAFALDMITEEEMGSVTGQVGVSIAVDDIKIYQNIEYVTYSDSDGPTAGGTGGMVRLDNVEQMQHLNGITGIVFTDPNGSASALLPAPVFSGDEVTSFLTPGADMQGNHSVGLNYKNVWNGGAYRAFASKALTIDVGRLPILSTGMAYNNTALGLGLALTDITGVRIGIPTLEIVTDSMSFDISVYDLDQTAVTSLNNGGSMGRVAIGNQTQITLNGKVEIAAH